MILKSLLISVNILNSKVFNQKHPALKLKTERSHFSETLGWLDMYKSLVLWRLLFTLLSTLVRTFFKEKLWTLYIYFTKKLALLAWETREINLSFEKCHASRKKGQIGPESKACGRRQKILISCFGLTN